MKETIDAIYKDGVLRLARPLDIPDGRRVRVVVETVTPASAATILALAGRVYEGLSEEEIAEVEAVALRRDRFSADGR